MADFDELLRLDPKSRWTTNNRCRAWGGKNDYPKAIADFSEAIGLDPKASGAYSNRAATYSIMKEYKKALADYDEAVRLNPTSSAYNAQAWLLATCSDAACRDGKKAVALAKKAL